MTKPGDEQDDKTLSKEDLFQLLEELLGESLTDSSAVLFGERLYERLKATFSTLKNIDELPDRIRRLSNFPVTFLSLVISPEKLLKLRPAIAYLYPNADKDIAGYQGKSIHPTSTFAFTSALFRYWALLSSDQVGNVIEALVHRDLSKISDKTTSWSPQSDVVLEILSILTKLRASKSDVSKLFPRDVVKEITVEELNDEEPGNLFTDHGSTQTNNYRMILSVDPFYHIDEILERVRTKVEKRQQEIREHYEKNKDVPRGIAYYCDLNHPLSMFTEMDFLLPYHDKELFSQITPLQYYHLKQKGDKGRDLQKVTEDWFHALLTYNLRKRLLRPVDIERRFFGLTAAPNTKAYKAQTKAHNDRYNRALTLIDRAVNCLPIQV